MTSRLGTRVFLDGGGAERPPTRMRMDRQGHSQAGGKNRPAGGANRPCQRLGEI